MNDPAVKLETKEKISEDSARAQVAVLFEAFELDQTNADGEELSMIRPLVKAIRKGRLEISGSGDDVKIVQIFKKSTDGKDRVEWNWMRLGQGRARVKLTQDGMKTFGNSYATASPMIGIPEASILTMHPLDLSLVEDIAGFFSQL